DPDELALAHLERDAVEDHRLVVADHEVLHLKERHLRSPNTPRSPSGSSRSAPANRRPAPRRDPSRSPGRRWTSPPSACARSSAPPDPPNAAARSDPPGAAA